MASDDININVKVTGVEQLSALSHAMRQLNVGVAQGVSNVTNLDARATSLGTALGRTSRGANDHAKSLSAVITNQKALSKEMSGTSHDIAALTTGFAKNSYNASANASSLKAYNEGLKSIKTKVLKEDLSSLSKAMIATGKDSQYVGYSMVKGLTAPLLMFGRVGLSAVSNVDKELTRINKILENTANSTTQAFEKMGIGVGEAITPAQQAQAEKMVKTLKDMDTALTGISMRYGVARELVISIAGDFAELGLQSEKSATYLAELSVQTEKLGDMNISGSKNLVQTMYQNATTALQDNADMQGIVISGTYKEAEALKIATGQLYAFNAIENVTALSLSDIGKAFPEVAATAQAFGISMTEVAALLAPMKAAGFEVGASATSIKVSLQRLNSPSKQTKDMLDTLAKTTGVDFPAAAGIGINSIDRLAHAFTTLQKNSEYGVKGTLQFFSQMFGTRQGTRMEVAIRDMATFNTEIGNVGSAAYNLTKIANDTINAQNALNGSTIPVIKSMSDMANTARVAASQVGQQIEYMDSFGKSVLHTVTQEDIQAAALARGAVAAAVLDAKKKGQDLISQIGSQSGRVIAVEFAGGAANIDLAQKELKAATGTIDTALQRIKNNFKLVAAQMMSGLRPVLDFVDQWATKISNFFQQMSPGMKAAITGFLAFVAVLGPLKMAVGGVQVAVGFLANGLISIVPGLAKVSAGAVNASSQLMYMNKPLMMVNGNLTTSASKFGILVAKMASGDGVIAGVVKKFGLMTGILKAEQTAQADVAVYVEKVTLARANEATAISASTFVMQENTQAAVAAAAAEAALAKETLLAAEAQAKAAAASAPKVVAQAIPKVSQRDIRAAERLAAQEAAAAASILADQEKAAAAIAAAQEEAVAVAAAAKAEADAVMIAERKKMSMWAESATAKKASVAAQEASAAKMALLSASVKDFNTVAEPALPVHGPALPVRGRIPKGELGAGRFAPLGSVPAPTADLTGVNTAAIELQTKMQQEYALMLKGVEVEKEKIVFLSAKENEALARLSMQYNVAIQETNELTSITTVLAGDMQMLSSEAIASVNASLAVMNGEFGVVSTQGIANVNTGLASMILEMNTVSSEAITGINTGIATMILEMNGLSSEAIASVNLGIADMIAASSALGVEMGGVALTTNGASLAIDGFWTSMELATKQEMEAIMSTELLNLSFIEMAGAAELAAGAVGLNQIALMSDATAAEVAAGAQEIMNVAIAESIALTGGAAAAAAVYTGVVATEAVAMEVAAIAATELAVAEVAASGGGFLAFIGSAIAGLASFAVGLLSVGGLMTAIGTALGITAIVAAIALVVGGVMMLIDAFRTTKDSMKPIHEAFNLLKNAFINIITPIKDAISVMLGFGDGKTASQVGKIGGVIKAIAKSISDFINENVVPAIKVVMTAAANVVHGVMQFIQVFIELFHGNWKKALGLLVSSLGTILRAALNVVKFVVDKWIDLWLFTINATIDLFFGLDMAIKKAVGGAIQWVAEKLADLIDMLPSWVPFAHEGAGALRTVGKAVSDFADGAANVEKKIAKGLKGGIGAIVGIGKKGIDGVFNTIDTGLNAVTQGWVKNIDGASKKIKYKAQGDAPEISEIFTSALGSGIDKAAGAVSGKLKDLAQKFIDSVLGIVSTSIKDVVDEMVKALESQKSAAMAVYDAQLATLDKLEKAEASLTAEMQYQSDRRKMIAERALQVQNYQRNRALAIYEGRIDDARVLSLEESSNKISFDDSVAKIDSDRQKTLAKENLDALKKAIEESKSLASKFFDDSVQQFKDAANLITKFPPQTVEQYGVQLDMLNAVASQAATKNGETFGEMMKQMVTHLADDIPNQGVPVFTTSLDQLVAVAESKYGLSSTGPDGTIIGATIGMLMGISGQITGNATDIVNHFGAIVTDIQGVSSVGFDVLANDIITPALDNLAQIFVDHNPFKVFADAILEANYRMLLDLTKIFGGAGSVVDALGAKLDGLVVKYTLANEAAAAGAGGGGGGGGGGSPPGKYVVDGVDYANPAVWNGSAGLTGYGAAESNRYVQIGAVRVKLEAGTRMVINPVGKFNGGIIPAFANGGYNVPGPESQGVHALLHGGEFVINAAAVKNIGMATLTGLNNMRYRDVPKNPDYKVSSGSTTNSTVNIIVDNFIGEDQWFNELVSKYNMNVVPRNQKNAGLEGRVLTSYSGLSRGM